MLSGLAQAGTKALGGARFSLVNLVPSAFLVGFLTFLATSGLYTGGNPDVAHAVSTLGENVGWTVTAVFGIFLSAVLLRPFQAAFVQLLEGGYWQEWPMLRHFEELATERHRRHKHTAWVWQIAPLTPAPPTSSSLQEAAQVQRLKRKVSWIKSRSNVTLSRYPAPRKSGSSHDDRLMPTLLGNRLRDGEDHAGDRYSLKFEVVAQRLYPSLSPKLAAIVSQNLDLIDTSAALCIAFAVAAIASLPLIGRWDAWSLTPLAAATLSALAYRGALRIAEQHARVLATIVDLHRFDMLESLHYGLPKTTDQEQLINWKLSRFLEGRESAHDVMREFRYVHKQQKSSHDSNQEDKSESPSAEDEGGSA